MVESGRSGAVPENGEIDGRRWASLALDSSPQSVPAARAWARDLAETWDLGDLDWTLLQLLTELVTNSVLHAGTGSVVRIEQEIETAAVRCAVSDFNPARPRRRVHTSQATTGRGLQMLEQLSSSWGVEPSPSGKTVWFELRAGAGGEIGEDYWEALADLEMTSTPVDSPAAFRTVLEISPRPRASFPDASPGAGEGLAA